MLFFLLYSLAGVVAGILVGSFFGYSLNLNQTELLRYGAEFTLVGTSIGGTIGILESIFGSFRKVFNYDRHVTYRLAPCAWCRRTGKNFLILPCRICGGFGNLLTPFPREKCSWCGGKGREFILFRCRVCDGAGWTHGRQDG